MLTPLPRPDAKEKKRVATKATNPNHRKAQVACAWWQFCLVLGELFVTLLERVYACCMLDAVTQV